MHRLNREQEQAVAFLHGTCSVIAVPGSGKTHVMMRRIGKLVSEHNIPPESILGLTFTRNAADEMRSRLVPILGDLSDRVMLNTIHGFCHFLLRSEGYVFEILYGKDQIMMVKDIIRRLRLRNLSSGQAISQISLAKNNLISLQEFQEIYGDDRTMLEIARVFEAYEREKRTRMLMDFDDLLCETHKLLSENEDIRTKYRATFRHLLIDEFQDTNPAQIEIVKLLMGRGSDDDVNNDGDGTSLFVVGDDWQAIYAFTGASVGNILNFRQHFPDAYEFILNINYRSTPQILQACQNLIAHNRRKIEKILRTDNPNGDDVRILESSNEETEALNIAAEIHDLVERGYRYRDIAVLYRANFQSRIIEEVFSSRRVPYRIQGGLNFYDRSEVKTILDYLRLIQSPDSEEGDEALKSVINKPNRYAGRKFIAELEQFAHERDMHLYPALRIMPIDTVYVRKGMRDFAALLDPLIENAQRHSPCEVIGQLRAALDYDRFVTDEDIPSPDDTKIANINQLQLAAAKHRTIESLLEFTERFDMPATHDKDGVNLMTIHKAKGLEFPVVFIAGMIEGILPGKKGDLEEERRICFVGISRAMKLLYLSYSHAHLSCPARRSVFIDEIMGNKAA